MNDQTKMWIYAIGGGVILALIAAKMANAQTPSTSTKLVGGGGKVGGDGTAPPACASVQITTSSGALNVRAEPNSSSSKVGDVGSGSIVEVDQAVEGESVNGTTIWYHLKDGSGYISGAYSRCV